MMSRSKKVFFVSICLMILALFSGCGDREGESRREVRLILGAYTTPREAYSKALIPAFQSHWKDQTGQNIRFQESYLGSGAQARAIVGGFEADVAALSLEADVERIVREGLITHDWKSRPHGGMVTNSIVVIAVRPGNPQGIQDWADLARLGVDVLTPDPKTSGGAMWNICAMYGAALRGFVRGVPAEDPQAAGAFLASVFRNVFIMDKGARESITNFERGVGDVALTYENEVIVGKQAGQEYEYVIPRSTILIENPVALIDRNVDTHGVRPVAEAFLDFLWRREAQRAFANFGLRPVDSEVAAQVEDRYPRVHDLWKIDFLGGWEQAIPNLFGPQGVYTKMYEELHQSK